MAYESDIYAKYAAGELPEEERQKLEQSGELEELDKILNTTNELKLPAYDFDKAYAQLKQRNQKVVKPLIVRRLALPLSIAASLLLISGAFLFFGNRATTIAADHHGNKTHLFRDGSEIILNNGSTISYQEKNWDKARTVNLNGEGYFKVEKGTPFIVKTSYGEIQVLGTSFNIRTHDNMLEVKCFTGKVQVFNQKGTSKILQAKKAIRLINQQFEPIKKVEKSQPSWQNGFSEFENTKVQLVFEELERQYNVDVIGDFPDELFTGRFAHQNLPDALNKICKPLNLNCTYNKEKNQVEVK